MSSPLQTGMSLLCLGMMGYKPKSRLFWRNRTESGAGAHFFGDSTVDKGPPVSDEKQGEELVIFMEQTHRHLVDALNKFCDCSVSGFSFGISGVTRVDVRWSLTLGSLSASVNSMFC